MVDGTAVGGGHQAAARVGEARVARTVGAPVVHGGRAVLQAAHQHALRLRVVEVGLTEVVTAAALVHTLANWNQRGGVGRGLVMA